MEKKPTIAVTKAAQQYTIPKPTLASWIKNKTIIATRADEGPRSPWMIDVASLEAHLQEKGKLPESPAEEDQPTNSDTENTPEPQEMPSLRDHKIVKGHTQKPAPELPPYPVKRDSAGAKHHSHSAKPKARGKKSHGGQSTYPMRIATKQLKDALSFMTLDEMLDMRNWLTSRIDKRVNS